MKILVVDDTERNLSAAKEAFFGETAVYCSTPTEALEVLENEQFDFVLTDMVMPKDKIDITKILEADEERNPDTSSTLQDACASGMGPVGLLIAEKAIEKGTPIAIVSFLGHHSQFEGAFHLAKEMFLGRFSKRGPQDPWEGSWCGYNSQNQFGLFSESMFENDENISEEALKGSSEGWKRIFKLFSETKETQGFKNIPV